MIPQKTRRWTNQYIDLLSTKPELISSFHKEPLGHESISDLQKIFAKYPRLYCELGSGAGAHLVAQASRDRDALFVGFELRFKRVYRTAEKSEKQGITNLKVLQLNAKQVSQVFLPNQLDGIYINFPDPWADKRRWHKHRLLKSEYIDELLNIVKPGGFISYKTDHTANFSETVSIFETKAGITVPKMTLDLYHSEFLESNVSSEFERLFASRGDPIGYLLVKKI